MSTWSWVDLFSEGGPFLLAEEAAFRAWPGASGWGEALADLAAPGKLHGSGAQSVCLFDPEDPGPIQVGLAEDRIALVRWLQGDGSPARFGALDDAGRQSFDAAVRAALDAPGPDAAVEALGTLEIADGLVVIAWAAVGGAEAGLDREALEALARSEPRRAQRFRDSGPAITAVRLSPGRYGVTGVFGHVVPETEAWGAWIVLARD